jgi:hypothetical protein
MTANPGRWARSSGVGQVTYWVGSKPGMAGSALSRRPSHPRALAQVTASRLVPSSLSPPKAVFTERTRLIASTSAGLLVILDLDTGEADPYRIAPARFANSGAGCSGETKTSHSPGDLTGTTSPPRQYRENEAGRAEGASAMAIRMSGARLPRAPSLVWPNGYEAGVEPLERPDGLALVPRQELLAGRPEPRLGLAGLAVEDPVPLERGLVLQPGRTSPR